MYIIMPLRCSDMPTDAVIILNEKITTLPVVHPFRKDCMNGDVVLTYSEGVTLFHSSSGFYFYRCEPTEAIRRAIIARENCMCTAFELNGDMDIPAKFLSRLEEQHGVRKAATIDSVVTLFNGVKLMLVKFPPNIIRDIMQEQGGVLKTYIRGSYSVLASISSIKDLLGPDTGESRIQRCLATEYASKTHAHAKSYHNALIQDVIDRPNSGICIGPIGRWDA